MYALFIFTADFTFWQQSRIYSACRTYISVLDPGFDADPLCLDEQHVGWWFNMTSNNARQKLIWFFSTLVGKVTEDHLLAGPTSESVGDVVLVSNSIAGATR